jgi:hypothetical protein
MGRRFRQVLGALHIAETVSARACRRKPRTADGLRSASVHVLVQPSQAGCLERRSKLLAPAHLRTRLRGHSDSLRQRVDGLGQVSARGSPLSLRWALDAPSGVRVSLTIHLKRGGHNPPRPWPSPVASEWKRRAPLSVVSLKCWGGAPAILRCPSPAQLLAPLPSC